MVTEYVINLLREIVHDKQFNINSVNDLLIKITQAILVKGLPKFADAAPSSDEQLMTAEERSISINFQDARHLDSEKIKYEKLIENRNDALKFFNSVIDFFDEKCKESKSREYKKVWRAFCQYCFSNYNNCRMPACLILSNELIAYISKMLYKFDVSTQDKTALFDVI